MMARLKFLLDVFTLFGLIAATIHISSRFDSSSSFSRPHFFSISALCLAAVLSYALSRPGSTDYSPVRLPAPFENPAKIAIPYSPILKVNLPAQNTAPVRFITRSANHVLTAVRRVRSPPVVVLALASIVVCRCLLFWYLLENMECSWSWPQAILPLCVLFADAYIPWQRAKASLLYARLDVDAGSTRDDLWDLQCHSSRQWGFRQLILTILWTFATTQVIIEWERPTGVICPRGQVWTELFPTLQFVCIALDSTFFTLAYRIRALNTTESNESTGPDHSATSRCWKMFGHVFLVSAAALATCALSTFTYDHSIPIHSSVASLEAFDMMVDSLAAAVLLVSAIRILARLHPVTILVILCGLGTFVRYLANFGYELLERKLDGANSILYPAVIVMSTGLIVRRHRDTSAQPHANPPDRIFHRAIISSYMLLAVAAIYSVFIFQAPGEAATQAPELNSTITTAHSEFERWQASASASRTLQEAVKIYRQRQGIPPPPNFDKWYEFARSKNSPIIDDFAQIESDLMPFWGIKPSTLRDMTAHLLEYPKSSTGGLRIQDGEIKISPHVPGTHLWMVMGLADMIRPFAKWLPDMDIAMNLDDECRVAVPFEEKSHLLREAGRARARLGKMGSESLTSSYASESSGVSPWPIGPWKEDGARDKALMPPLFADYHAKPIYQALVAPTCPPDSPARRWRWQNKKATCLTCMAPHTTWTLEGRVVTNWTGAQDVCHQPDVAHLNGFMRSPAAMVATQTLLPIFSQGKVAGFNDILIPSPWNFHSKTAYDESADLPWDMKNNTVFWRGSATDGFASRGSWVSFPRARFVNEAEELAAGMDDVSTDDLRVRLNVSFVGGFSRCEQPDCKAELQHFYATSPILAANEQDVGSHQPGEVVRSPSVPFEEHWKYKHLVDLDGAGFSGRFIPFMQSRSLVYRAGLFRTWFDERIHPWRHYIPLDTRLGMGTYAWYSVANFFGSRLGSPVGERIALEGREWAQKALRPADMEVYLFRLLLEWGRVVDDRREVLGYFD